MSSVEKKKMIDDKNFTHPNIVKYSQGVTENTYKEVVHASPAKVEKIKKLLSGGKIEGYELNIEVWSTCINELECARTE